jgi:alpha/beta superfamily hydrolase
MPCYLERSKEGRSSIGMGSQRIAFTNDGVTCEGVFVHPDEVDRTPGIVICHPHPLYGGDMGNNVVVALAEAFAAAGFAVLRFNFRGVGRSTGHYAEGIGEQGDARAALAWLSSQPGIAADRLFLAGYSFGARVTLAVASTDPRVRGFIVVAPPVLRGDWPAVESSLGPKIFLCGDRDPYAPPEVLTGMVHSLPEPKRLIVFPDTDHFFVGQERGLAQHAVKLLQELS